MSPPILGGDILLLRWPCAPAVSAAVISFGHSSLAPWILLFACYLLYKFQATHKAEASAHHKKPSLSVQDYTLTVRRQKFFQCSDKAVERTPGFSAEVRILRCLQKRLEEASLL